MKKRILCIGDSNTWGYIPDESGRYEEDVRWTGRLAAALGEGYAVVEEGMNGRTTAFVDRGEPGVSAMDYLYSCLISQFPLDGIIVMLGTNDSKCRYHMSAREIGKGMEEVIWEIERVCARKEEHPRILIVAPGPIYYQECWPVRFNFDDVSIEKIGQLGERYADIARRHGCHFLNLYPELGAEEIGEDGIHLTPKGHAKVAVLMEKALREMGL